VASDRSYRRIVETSTIIAGASIINIMGGLLRMKLAAVVLGPAGIGLVGLYQNFVSTAASVSSLGISTVGTRKIAEALSKPDSHEMAIARRALMVGAIFLSVIGMVVVWLFRSVIAKYLLGDSDKGEIIGWLSIGVALTTYSGAQSAYLNGLQRIGDLARLSIISGVAATIIGVAVLLGFGAQGILLFVLVIPAMTCIVGKWLTHRLRNGRLKKVSMHDLRGEWGGMLKLGVAVVFASAMFGLAQLALRSMVVKQLGPDSLGHFQAAWAISVVYAGIVFQAMGVDYFPRLAQSNGDATRQNILVNEQGEVILLLAAPFFILVLSLAPWVIRIAYSSDFSESVGLLRCQVVGDILKIAGWPIGFISLARGDSRSYLIVEMVSSFVLVVVSWLLLRYVGLLATGIGFVAMNFTYLVAVLIMAFRRTGYIWQLRVRNRFLLVLGVACAVFVGSLTYPSLSAAVGVCLALLLGADSLRTLSSMSRIDGSLGKVLTILRRWLGGRS